MVGLAPGLADAAVDAGALVGAVRAPVALGAAESFAARARKSGGAGAHVGLEADPVLAGLGSIL
jgi:hypothetical protein